MALLITSGIWELRNCYKDIFKTKTRANEPRAVFLRCVYQANLLAMSVAKEKWYHV